MAVDRGITVVEIDGSSDEDERVPAVQLGSLSPKNFPSSQSGKIDTDPSKQKFEIRSFWKAGIFDAGPPKFDPGQGELEHARVHPKFLHSNATSHKWAFGAIAELLDNAVDEVPNGATFVKVDKILNKRDNTPVLLFLDDGGGMDPDGLRKCMSLGYSSKKANTTIGQYGNGFKTSTMRLGADVIVFSRSTRSGKATESIGLLSYTYLRKTGQDDVIIPMVDFDISSHWAEPIVYSSQDDWSTNLNTILEWSPFPSKDELMMQFDDIGSHGTKIIIFNLWLNDEGIYELSFDDDDADIRLRDEASSEKLLKINKRTEQLQSHISYRIRFSLRAYASILYLRPFKNFQILLRGKPVKQLSITDDLKYKNVVTYRPQLGFSSEEVSVKMTIGFIKEAPNLAVSGFNVYHKNRLIRPFWKVTPDGNSKGYGVVGVLEANFIEPAHDKQDFERSSVFVRLETKLKSMVMEYWRSSCHLVGFMKDGVRKPQPSSIPPSTIPGLTRRLEVHSGNGAETGNASASQPVTLFHADPSQVSSLPGSDATSIEKIRTENIQLFLRCEEFVQQENQLRQTITKLQNELEDTKRKTEQLASYVESQKKLAGLVPGITGKGLN
ncbi:hypothetical protein V2J09_004296 [Rumex salicifolius]